MKIFISSPYTKGDVNRNVRVQMDAFNALIGLGFTPMAPLHLHFQDLIHPLKYEQCITWCLDWIEACDLLLRFPGESSGADREMAHAHKLKVPIIANRYELSVWLIQECPYPEKDKIIHHNHKEQLLNLMQGSFNI